MTKRKRIKVTNESVSKEKSVTHEVWVQPGRIVRWKIEFDGTVVFRARTKDEAVLLGRLLGNLAGLGGPTELFICKRDGQIEERSTFPREADPHPPAG